MAWWRLLFTTATTTAPKSKLSLPNINPKPNPLKPTISTSHFSTSFLITKIPLKHKPKRKKKPSPRTTPVQPSPTTRLPHLESLLLRDARFRFLTRTKSFLSKQPHQVLSLSAAAKLHRELGFPRGRKPLKSVLRHPLLFQTHRHTDNTTWLGFTPIMEALQDQEQALMNQLEKTRVTTIKKLLMMSAEKRLPLSKLYHCRSLFGISEEFRDRVGNYPDDFRLVVESDGKRVLELVNWDPTLAVSVLEREFMVDEDKVKRAFRFPVKHGRELGLGGDDERRLNLLNTLPLVSPYSDGAKLDLWTLEAEKYRVGVIHEFLSLTLEKRASIHHVVEFKEELSLTKHTYQMLLRQPRTFYLAGTEMNWAVFLKDAYGEDGELISKDPQVVFNEKLYRYAEMQEMEPGLDISEI
ncbi:hypothetical protein RJ639_022966 [Escallonia herrerae]|uniref:PORR domain-containing protein n=1 Tax=Escallonia herrerae TaxID=1293975 RepID=A0AA88V259_9ASTE|nr:hypothetical protein RJ639_022966 [Escallonia herrerae]